MDSWAGRYERAGLLRFRYLYGQCYVKYSLAVIRTLWPGLLASPGLYQGYGPHSCDDAEKVVPNGRLELQAFLCLPFGSDLDLPVQNCEISLLQCFVHPS